MVETEVVPAEDQEEEEDVMVAAQDAHAAAFTSAKRESKNGGKLRQNRLISWNKGKLSAKRISRGTTDLN